MARLTQDDNRKRSRADGYNHSPMVWVLGSLVLLQCVLSMRRISRWRHFMEANPEPGSLPPVTLIVPCRGEDAGLRENLQAYCRQGYPDYELLVAVADEHDPAAAFANPKARFVRTAPRTDEGDKITKLRAAVAAARPESEAFVFGDSDGRPASDWLAGLMTALTSAPAYVGATTGYRWFIPPQRKLPSVIRAVWNSFIASVLGNVVGSFCWGGATAIYRHTFERLDVEASWRGALSDDYQLTKTLFGAGLRVRFVPIALVPDYSECGWRELFAWTTRQLLITRLYAPKLWGGAFAVNGFYTAGVAALLASLPAWPALALLAGIVAATAATGADRAAGARAVLIGDAGQIARLRWAYVLLSPLIPFLFVGNCVAAALTREVSWRGTRYRVMAPQQTAVVSRDAPAARPTGPR